jgi:2-methylcitrate dehydratase PrpD
MADAAKVSDLLAGFASSPLSAPAKAFDVARRLIETSVARAIAAAYGPAVRIALDAVLPLGTPPQARVLGRDEQLSAQWTAFVNGIAAHAAIVPSVLALAEHTGAQGDAILEAVIVGTEADLRLSEAVAPDHTDRGWDPAGTTAHVGAVLAAGRILQLDAARMRNALGIAATQSAGLWAAFGTMTQAYHLGKAAADAIEAALLARSGFSGPAQPIEGRRGFVALLARRFHPELVADGLGDRYLMEHTTLHEGVGRGAVRDVLARFALA